MPTWTVSSGKAILSRKLSPSKMVTVPRSSSRSPRVTGRFSMRFSLSAA